MQHTPRTFLIFGISKGLGKALTLSLPAAEDMVFGVSRTKPAYLDTHPRVHWIAADLQNPAEAIRQLKAAIGNRKIDYFIYNVGIWEKEGFTDAYHFDAVGHEETNRIIQTNLTSCICTTQAFIPNLKQSAHAKIILIGSTWGLENHNGREVAFAATKFGLRGMVHALRANLRPYKIGVSIINLGYLATEYEVTVPVTEVLEKTQGALIPLTDVVHAIRFIMATSYASCVKEIDMPAMQDAHV